MDQIRDSKPFEIGLVGAGAISAGAYTGGVIDYLTFALDAWYAAKAAGQDVPPHDVQLRVFSGASAGAITAALATAYLGSDQPSITTPQDAELHKGKNKLFHSWVEQIDIKYLLDRRDLADETSQVLSLLDSTVLRTIADDGLGVTARAAIRPYIAPNFELLMTVTNLRGIPYSFKVSADRDVTYDMSLHADYVHFVIGDQGVQEPGQYAMRWSDFGEPGATKEKMKISALASGAFPIGLAPRTLEHEIPAKSDWYSVRTWPVPTPHTDHPHSCTTQQAIPANWPERDFIYAFQCVDGGVMNNEPFELARKRLAAGGSNPRDPLIADKAMLMIDPFPSELPFNGQYAAEQTVLGTAFKLFGALKNQARFKPDELMLAADDAVASRYMIAPSRDGKSYPIACGSLGGFGGFLKRDFRSHDYFLGRRNAQKFFREHFSLPEKNPLFDGWPEARREPYYIKDEHGSPLLRNGQRLLPIIPLVGAADVECYNPVWPSYSGADMDALLGQAEARLQIVSRRLVDQYFSKHPLLGAGAKAIIWLRRRDILEKIKTQVSNELRKMELMTS